MTRVPERPEEPRRPQELFSSGDLGELRPSAPLLDDLELISSGAEQELSPSGLRLQEEFLQRLQAALEPTRDSFAPSQPLATSPPPSPGLLRFLPSAQEPVPAGRTDSPATRTRQDPGLGPNDLELAVFPQQELEIVTSRPPAADFGFHQIRSDT